jgi:hypothetical protein
MQHDRIFTMTILNKVYTFKLIHSENHNHRSHVSNIIWKMYIFLKILFIYECGLKYPLNKLSFWKTRCSTIHMNMKTFQIYRKVSNFKAKKNVIYGNCWRNCVNINQGRKTTKQTHIDLSLRAKSIWASNRKSWKISTLHMLYADKLKDQHQTK